MALTVNLPNREKLPATSSWLLAFLRMDQEPFSPSPGPRSRLAGLQKASVRNNVVDQSDRKTKISTIQGLIHFEGAICLD